VKIIKPSFARIKTLFARPLTRFIEENRTNEKKKPFLWYFELEKIWGKEKRLLLETLKN